MNEYASKRKMPLNEFKFEFDGEKLKGDETPAALDMESGDCIDVRVFVPLPQCSHASDDVFISQPQCSHASDDKPGDDRPSDNKDYFSIYYQDYTFVDSDSNGSDIQVLD